MVKKIDPNGRYKIRQYVAMISQLCERLMMKSVPLRNLNFEISRHSLV